MAKKSSAKQDLSAQASDLKLLSAGRPDASANQQGFPESSLPEEYYAVLVMALANRLHRRASSYYLKRWNVGITEYRLLLALGKNDGVNMAAVAATADLDKAAASRGFKQLEQNGWIRVEQTQLRGRASIVHLTDAGRILQAQLRAVSCQRDERFIAGLNEEDLAQFKDLIYRLMGNVDYMNQD
jgi:DNA-binding MarR family transcriptional regulator